MRFVMKILMVFVMIAVGFLFWNRSSDINESLIESSAIIEYPSEYNYVQTINDCGPFSVAAVVRALKGEDVDSGVFAEEIKWRLPNGYTLPWGLEDQLEENEILVEVASVDLLSDEGKILFLKERLSRGSPIIVLGEVGGFEHYMTVFGFDSGRDEFYLYDSLYEKNDDGDLPGNKILSGEELLDFWKGGGMYGFYSWYAIVASV